MATVQQISLNEQLQSGLRRFGHPLRNNFELVTLNNAECLPDGLHTVEEMFDAFTGNESIAWPGPHLFKGKDGFVRLLEKTVLSVVNVSAYPWVATPVTTYDFNTPGNTKAIPTGATWQFVDLGKSYMFFNGQCVVMYMPGSRLTDALTKVFVEDLALINSACYFRGRVLYGGLGLQSFHREWDTYLTGLADEYVAGQSSDMTAGQNMVWFSSIGGGDVLWPFDIELGMEGEIADGWYNQADNRPIAADFMKRNEGGMMNMPWSGQVEVLKPLGKAVMVYGDNGISAMTLETSPISTFGLHPILDIGIAGRSAVAGNEMGHLFVDVEGNAWLIGPDLLPTKLDYHEFFLPLVGDNLVVVHDPADNKYYISNETNGFILTQQGLSETWQSPTTLVHQPTAGVTDRFPIGMFADNSLGLKGEIQTDLFDVGLVGSATIEGVQIGARQDAPINVRIFYRTDVDSAVKVTGSILVDETGFAAVTVSGTEFQVEVIFDNADESTIANMDVDYIRVHYSVDGKKSVANLISGL